MKISTSKENHNEQNERNKFTLSTYRKWFVFFFLVTTSSIIYSGIVGWHLGRYISPRNNYYANTYTSWITIMFIVIMDMTAIIVIHFLFKPLRKFAENNEKNIIDKEVEEKAYKNFIKLPKYGMLTIFGAIAMQTEAILRNTIYPEDLTKVFLIQISFILLAYTLDYYWIEMEVGKRLHYFHFNIDHLGTSAKIKTIILIVLSFLLFGHVTALFFQNIDPANIGARLFYTFAILIPITTGVTFMIVTSLIVPINRLLKFFETVDFSINKKIRIPTFNADEFGKLTYVFEKLLNDMITIIAKNKEIAQALTEKAEELSSSIEELSATSQSISSTQQEISQGAATQVFAISEVEENFKVLMQHMKEIRKYMEDIEEISSFIQNISQQTNMLALNAAIEAARAGDAGRGFNVVAEQVRKLANESNEAMMQTNPIIEKINEITLTQEKLGEEITKKIEAIVSIAEDTSSGTEESASAAEEQSASMEQLSEMAQELLHYAEDLQINIERATKEVKKELKEKVLKQIRKQDTKHQHNANNQRKAGKTKVLAEETKKINKRESSF